MRRASALVLIAAVLVLAGCGRVSTDAAPEQIETSASPTPSATPTPVRTIAPSPTPTPTVTPTVAPAPPAPAPAPAPAPIPEPLPSPEPEPVPTLGPDDADPADYVSYAHDAINDRPLTGVSFTTSDGRTICGILTWGHGQTPAGTVSCTVDSHREILPQAFPDTGPYTMSVMAFPNTGFALLYPDWFAQPTRAIPVLPAGKTLTFEGTACTATDVDVTCRTAPLGYGFTLSPTGYTSY